MGIFTDAIITWVNNKFSPGTTKTSTPKPSAATRTTTTPVVSQSNNPSIFIEALQPKKNNATFEIILPKGAQDASSIKSTRYSFDIDFSNLEDGKQYYITGYKYEKNKDGKEVFIPETREIEHSTKSTNFNFSEGLERQITEIRVSSSLNKDVQNELIEIGKQKGFTVSVLQNKGGCDWIEDYSNFRPDGSVMTINDNQRIKGIISESRRGISSPNEKQVAQGAVAQGKTSSDYQQLINPNDIVNGKTYLEGGNVLTTYTKDGKPAAIIGEESLLTTKLMMSTQNSNISDKDVIALMAKDLGVDPKNITVIPQFDFHIDMSYRPLKNGQIAVPDFESAISILETTKLDGVSAEEQAKLLNKLKIDAEKTKGIREETINKLKQNGYSIVNIPCFSTIYENSEIARKNMICTNYMNAVCGTAPDNSTYYITNKSDYPALDKIIEKYFHDAGIDDVYFISTNTYLHREGGIDCLTKEIATNVN